MKKIDETITEEALIELGFVLWNTTTIAEGEGLYKRARTIKVYKHNSQFFFVGINSREIINDDRGGYYNTCTSLDEIKMALAEDKKNIPATKKKVKMAEAFRQWWLTEGKMLCGEKNEAQARDIFNVGFKANN